MLYSHQQSVNERKECLKTQNAFWDNHGTKWFILAHEIINLNLVEGQIIIQIVSFTWIRGAISEYNILVCQVGSEP